MAVQSVTNKSGGPRLRSVRAPDITPIGLSKPVGSIFSFTWGVVNNGDVDGFVQLRVLNDVSQAVLTSIGPLGVLPGSSVTLVATWQATDPSSWAIRMNLEEMSAPPESTFLGTIATDIGLIVSTPVGPQLVAVGDPIVS